MKTVFRITPAYAGKTGHVSDLIWENMDHPRVCGKDRGTGYRVNLRDRITPAYAGKTGWRHLAPTPFQDHPRVCGKDLTTTITMSISSGSPPRMRERLSVHSRLIASVGITPAYAGKTETSCEVHCQARDHPRVCGKDGNPYRKLLDK